MARKVRLKQESVSQGGHTEGRTGSGTVSHATQQRSGRRKKSLDVAVARPGWPTPYDVWLSGQMRAKGGIKTRVDLGASGSEERGEERVEVRGRTVGACSHQRGSTTVRKT